VNSLRLGENKDYQAVRQKVSEIETALAEARGTIQMRVVQSYWESRSYRELNQRIAAAIPGAQAEEVDTTLGGNGSRDSRIDMIADLIKSRLQPRGCSSKLIRFKLR